MVAAPAQAAPLQPFVCATGEPGLLIQGEPSSIQAVDLFTGRSSVLLDEYHATPINGVGYNVKDNYLYGTDLDTGEIVRIGADGGTENLGAAELNGTPIPTPDRAVGDVDEDGFFWTVGASKWWKVDLTTTPLTVVDSGTFDGTMDGYDGSADWAYVPGGGDYLYRVAEGPDGYYLFGFNRTTHGLTNFGNLGDLGVFNAKFGAIYADAAGNLYASDNRSGKIFRVDVHAVSAEWFADGPSAGNNDGARCVNSAIEADYGDAPNSYGTGLGVDGARHNIRGYDASADTAPLMLGGRIDAENNGNSNVGANGDDNTGIDDEDGVSTPITIRSGVASKITVTATNNSNEAATVAGWVDLNGNGTFDAAERSALPVPANSGTLPYELTFPAGTTTNDTYARFRVMSGADSGNIGPKGAAESGEVEDYRVTTANGGQLTVTKSVATPDGLRTGDKVRYTVKVKNTLTTGGDFTAQNPASLDDDLTDVLDDATFDGGAAVAFDAGSTSAAPAFAGNHLTWKGPLKAGETATITYTVTLKKGGDLTLTNAACVPQALTEPGAEPCKETETKLPKLQVEKQADKSTLPTDGATIHYTVTATNTGPGNFTTNDPAYVVDDLTDVLDDGAYIASSFSSNKPGVDDTSAPRIGWTGALSAGESVIITYDVVYDAKKAGGDHKLVNVAFVPDNPSDPTPACTTPTDTCDPNRLPGADLTVLKSVDPASGTNVAPGDELHYTLMFTNNGETAAAVDYTDHLDGVADDAVLTTPVASAPGLTASAITNGKSRITGSVPVGMAISVTYTATVKAFADQGDHVLENFLSPGTTPPPTDCVPGSPLCSTNPIPHLLMLKTVNPPSGSGVQSGDELTYTLHFANDGMGVVSVDKVDNLAAVLDDADLSDDPAATKALLSVTTVIDDQFRVTGNLSGGQSDTVTYSVTVKPDGQHGDNQLTNFLLDPFQSPPADGICPPLSPLCAENPVADLSVLKSVDPATGTNVAPGDELHYTLTFTNTGKAPALVDHTDHLDGVADDADLSALVPSAPDLTASAITNGKSRITGEVPGGQAITVTYTATVKAFADQGDHVIENFLVPGTTPPPTDCAPGSPLCSTNPIPHLVMLKTVDPASGSGVQSGDVLTYTLHFENDGMGIASVNKIDNLAAVLDDADLSDDPVATNALLSVTGVVDDQFTVTGSLDGGESSDVTYAVTVKPDGQHGDNQLTNFLLDPFQSPPADGICPPLSPLCAGNPVGELDDWKTVDPATGTAVDPGDELVYTLHFENVGNAPYDFHRVDDLTGLIDDADVTSAPSASDASLSASSITDGRFDITGELPVGDEVHTVTYTAEVRPDGDRGDDILANFLLDEGEDPPSDPCTPMPGENSDCTGNPVSGTVTAKKSVDPKSGSNVRAGDTLTYTLTFTNIGINPGAINYVDHLDNVLDDAVVVSQPKSSSSDVQVSTIVAGKIAVTGALKGGESATVVYAVKVKANKAQGNHRIANFLAPDGVPVDPDGECKSADPMCTTNGIDQPNPSGSILPDTGVAPNLAALLGGGLVFLLGGLMLLVRIRKELDGGLFGSDRTV